jgi:hypothetical protein
LFRVTAVNTSNPATVSCCCFSFAFIAIYSFCPIENSVAWVRERTIPSDASCRIEGRGIKGATWSAWRIPTAIFSPF